MKIGYTEINIPTIVFWLWVVSLFMMGGCTPIEHTQEPNQWEDYTYGNMKADKSKVSGGVY